MCFFTKKSIFFVIFHKGKNVKNTLHILYTMYQYVYNMQRVYLYTWTLVYLYTCIQLTWLYTTWYYVYLYTMWRIAWLYTCIQYIGMYTICVLYTIVSFVYNVLDCIPQNRPPLIWTYEHMNICYMNVSRETIALFCMFFQCFTWNKYALKDTF